MDTLHLTSCPSLPPGDTALDDDDVDEVDGKAKERCRWAVRDGGRRADGSMKACTPTRDVERLKRARANNISVTANGAIFAARK